MHTVSNPSTAWRAQGFPNALLSIQAYQHTPYVSQSLRDHHSTRPAFPQGTTRRITRKNANAPGEQLVETILASVPDANHIGCSESLSRTNQTTRMSSAIKQEESSPLILCFLSADTSALNINSPSLTSTS
jgi:hypothetical protein